MKEKSTLPPLFVLSFLVVSVISCIILIFFLGIFGSAYGYFAIKNIQSQPIKVTPGEQQLSTITTSVPSVTETSEVILTPSPTIGEVDITKQTETQKIPLTETPSPTAIIAFETPTPSVTIAPTSTQDPKQVLETQSIEMTLQAISMMDLIDDLNSKGKLHTKNGTYYRLPNLADESSDPSMFRRIQSGFSPNNFVLRSDLIWQVDNNQGNWAESGCGVIFRENAKGEYYLVFLSSDGRARLKRFIGSSLALLGRSTIFNVNRDLSEAELLLVVQGETVSIFINRELKYENYSEPMEGELSFTVVTGNPNGFGTRCWMNNTDLWIMEK